MHVLVVHHACRTEASGPAGRGGCSAHVHMVHSAQRKDWQVAGAGLWCPACSACPASGFLGHTPRDQQPRQPSPAQPTCPAPPLAPRSPPPYNLPTTNRQAMGFHIVVYPLSGLYSATRALLNVYGTLATKVGDGWCCRVLCAVWAGHTQLVGRRAGSRGKAGSQGWWWGGWMRQRAGHVWHCTHKQARRSAATTHAHTHTPHKHARRSATPPPPHPHPSHTHTHAHRGHGHGVGTRTWWCWRAGHDAR